MKNFKSIQNAEFNTFKNIETIRNYSVFEIINKNIKSIGKYQLRFITNNGRFIESDWYIIDNENNRLIGYLEKCDTFDKCKTYWDYSGKNENDELSLNLVILV